MGISEMDLTRRDLPVTASVAYLNAGSWGPLAAAAAEAMRERISDGLEHGRAGTAGYRAFGKAREAARAAFAEALSSEPERIALTHSTSGGMNLALGGIDLAEGDEIVSTDNEHPGLDEPLAELVRRRGVVVRRAEVALGGDPLEAFAALIGPRTRLVAASHVLWGTGRVLPLRPIAALAHARGALVLADGAQSIGSMAVDPAALGVDLYAVPGQKWLCGPTGLGALWIAAGIEEKLAIAQPSYYTRDHQQDGDPLWPGARRHDGCTLSTIAALGLAAAVRWRADSIGWEAGFERAAAQAASCRARLHALDRVEVIEPGGPLATLISFNVDGAEPEAVNDHLAAAGIIARHCPTPRCVRVSVGFWTSGADIDRLAGALATI